MKIVKKIQDAYSCIIFQNTFGDFLMIYYIFFNDNILIKIFNNIIYGAYSYVSKYIQIARF